MLKSVQKQAGFFTFVPYQMTPYETNGLHR